MYSPVVRPEAANVLSVRLKLVGIDCVPVAYPPLTSSHVESELAVYEVALLLVTETDPEDVPLGYARLTRFGLRAIVLPELLPPVPTTKLTFTVSADPVLGVNVTVPV